MKRALAASLIVIAHGLLCGAGADDPEDGVTRLEDLSDERVELISEDEVKPAGAKVILRTVLGRFYFAYGSEVLSASAKNSLDRIASEVAELGEGKLSIQLFGYTDSSGFSWDNWNLAALRAKAVAKVLRPKVPASIPLRLFSVGDDEKFLDREDKKNRRVDAVLKCESTTGSCACRHRSASAKVAEPNASAGAIEAWSLSLVGDIGGAIAKCGKDLFVETRFTDVSTGMMRTTVRSFKDSAEKAEKTYIWSGDVGAGDEVLVSMFPSTKVCSIGLNDGDYGTFELDVSEYNGALVPKINPGRHLSEPVPTNDYFRLSGTIEGCALEFEARVDRNVILKRTY